MGRLAFAMILLAAGLAVGLISFKAAPPTTFITAPVERGRVTNVVEATGTVHAKLTVDVSSQLSGQVAEVFVDFNAAVKSGQPLAQLDQDIFIARANEARAALMMAKAAAHMQQASVDRAKLSIGNARTAKILAEAQAATVRAKQEESEREFERKTKLAHTGNVPERDLSQARTARDMGSTDLRAASVQVTMKSEAITIAEADLRFAESSLENAEAVVQQKQASLDQAESDLKRTVIRSPIDGIVLDRNIDPGQTIAVTLEAKTLFTIANDLGSMEVQGRIDEADIGRLKVGQTVDFTVDAFPDRKFAGAVVQIRKAAKVVQNVVSYTVVVSAPNPDYLLLPDMTAQLRIVVSDTGEALKIPNQALRFRPSGLPEPQASSATSATLWIIGRDGNPAAVSVEIGQSDEHNTELLKGPIGEGDPLIIGTASRRPRVGLFGIPLWF